MPTQTVLPPWRGFNLPDMIRSDNENHFQEDDFRWISEWGFDFVRLPLCYKRWTNGDDMFNVNEAPLEHVDQAVGWGRKYGIHVCINFHWAPGYRVGMKDQRFLWKDENAQKAFCFHWGMFAERYKGIPPEELSFNPVNEPGAVRPESMTREDHERVVRAVVETVRSVDPRRLIIIDGVQWAFLSCPELADLDVAQSCRGYKPRGVTHYKAKNAGKECPEPTWPGGVDSDGSSWDRARLQEHYEQWAELARLGIGIHCGECGCFNNTPHQVVLDWFRDLLEVLTSLGIGYALWNLRGPLGILDSKRADVQYEDWHGHVLDRKLLALLQEF